MLVGKVVLCAGGLVVWLANAGVEYGVCGVRYAWGTVCGVCLWCEGKACGRGAGATVGVVGCVALLTFVQREK